MGAGRSATWPIRRAPGKFSSTTRTTGAALNATQQGKGTYGSDEYRQAEQALKGSLRIAGWLRADYNSKVVSPRRSIALWGVACAG
ncbi:hypothetical protein KCP76_24715 [Salmonella enterica subsp. enterica serovar Weltevreden]|nr:hypothetical protein KCP76_24715 [Salmonella enterica subsp. enterica serovar Weltevreden]